MLMLFLVATAAAAAVVPPPSTNSPSEGDQHKVKVVIVGAGASGMSAVATLLQNNVTDVVVLEASDRVGGRIHTIHYGGIPLDMGAEYVHGEKDNIVYNMVSETFNASDMLYSYAETLMKPEQALYANTRGDVFNNTFVESVVHQAYDILDFEDSNRINQSAYEYFNSKLDELLETNQVSVELGEAVRHLAHLMHNGYNGHDNLSQLGVSSLTQYEENLGDLTLKWRTTSGGYSILFDMLAKKIPHPENELPILSKVLFNKHVSTISMTDGGETDGVRVQCADGSVYLADHVIVTVSLGVLKKHAEQMFHPPLPEDKMAAIQTLGFGSVGKAYILFSTRWWPESVTNIKPLFSNRELEDFVKSSKHGHWSANTSGFYAVGNHSRMLEVWITGPSCRYMETLPEDQVMEGLMELLQATAGHLFNISTPESVRRSSWNRNPYTLGSYSFHSVDSDKGNYTNEHIWRPILNENHKPVILFAGEATHSHYYSTVHGAVEKGAHAASAVIKVFKGL